MPIEFLDESPPKSSKIEFLDEPKSSKIEFLDDTPKEPGLFGSDYGKPSFLSPIATKLVAKATGVSPEDASNAMLAGAREPGRMARRGLNSVIDLAIPPSSPSTSIVKSNSGVTRDIARGFLQAGSDIAASHIDPEAAAVAGAGVLAKPFLGPIGSLAKMVGSKIAEKAPGLARPFVYRFGQPAAYQAMAEGRIANIGAGAEKAGEVGTELSKGLSQAEQQRAGQIIKGGLSTGEKEAPLRAIAKKAGDELTKLGASAVEEGLLDEGTYLKNVQKYMPRLYRKYEETGSLAGELFGTKPQRIIGKRFLERKEIPADVRAFMGEIKEPAYPVARGIAQLTHDVETAKLFRSVAENPKWAVDPAAKTIAGKAPMIPEGFVQMDSTRRLGALADKWVHPEIASDINEIIRVPGQAEKVYKDIIHAWKFGKVILNPATHARNMMSNSILMDVVGGVDLQKQPALLVRAGKDILNKGQYFQEAKTANLLGHEFSGAEIKAFLNDFDKPADTMFGKIMNIPKKTAKGLGRTYQKEEQFFKMAQFIHGREAGMSIKAAADLAEKTLFNYDKVSPALKTLRSSPFGAPFATFTAKAIPAVADAAIKNPMRIYKYKILFDSLENMAREKFDLTDKEINTIKRNQRGAVAILPFKDKAGNLQTLDLSYILPWGDVGEQGGFAGLPPSLTPGGVVKPVIEAIGNKSLFKAGYAKFDPSKAQIWLDSDPTSTKVRKSVDYVYKAWAPSFAPPIPGVSAGGYHTEKLIKAQEGKADYFGRVRSVAMVLADIMLGLKVSPVDPKMLDQFDRLGMKRELDEIRREVKAKYRNQGASEEERAQAKQVMTEKIQELLRKKSEME